MKRESDANALPGPGDTPQNHSARPYEPPRLIRVNLRPEEAVLGHCKISGSAGPASGSCTVPGCFTPGS
jgi:hypothetical protein